MTFTPMVATTGHSLHLVHIIHGDICCNGGEFEKTGTTIYCPPFRVLPVSAQMGLERVWTIPLCHFVFTIASFLISYVIASNSRFKHVDAFWPYIRLVQLVNLRLPTQPNHIPCLSDSGALPPESCVFGQLLNLSALFR